MSARGSMPLRALHSAMAHSWTAGLPSTRPSTLRVVAARKPFRSWLRAPAATRDGAALCSRKLSGAALLAPPRMGPLTPPPARALHVAASADADAAAGTAVSEKPAELPKEIQGQAIRARFLEYFEKRGHTRKPSSSLVPEDPTVLLTIAGMLQFKPIFLGQAVASVPRATTTQKCVRTNDIENVGVTKRHHTFFEMLGNFSFGDYFKQEAIEWAWDLSTKEFKLDPDRVWVSVFREDDEAYNIWKDVVGVKPEHIQRLDEADNFWASGATGPCGPCSELYYDFKPEAGVDGANLAEDDDRFIEFYNLVFMESNRDAAGKLTPLANKNIDTGMGLERMAQILQGAANNYETDLIFPIVQKAAELAGVDYHSSDARVQQYLKVIGDHTRAVVYLISDGVSPSNIGRGYIVRRLLRRVVRCGRLIGINQATPFTPLVADVAIALSAGCDPAVAGNAERIRTELEREELRFVQTLERGEALLEDMLAAAEAAGSGAILTGRDAFTLYDTYGFPVEITQEVAAERGVAVDMAAFQEAMEAQRAQSQAAAGSVDLTVGNLLAEVADRVQSTDFLGYTELSTQSCVAALVGEEGELQAAPAGATVQVVLDRTPFYAESGGQVGDRGVLVASSGAVVEIVDTTKAAGGRLSVHQATVTEGELTVGDTLSAEVDAERRRRIIANHTATHLLQSALKKVLGDDVAQAGSLNGPDRLRFDFNYPQAMTPAQLEEVEGLVNRWIGEAHSVVTTEMDLAEAKAAGATAMFGEKYDDKVRVVDVPNVSMELCGGTHVRTLSEIRGFKIVAEAGIAAGVRRVEAVTGDGVMALLASQDRVVSALSATLKVKPDEVVERVEKMLGEAKAAQKEVAALKGQLALAKSAALVNAAVEAPDGTKVVVEQLDGVDAKSLQGAAEQILAALGDPAAVVLGSVLAPDKVALVAAFSPAVVKTGLKAGQVVGAAAKVCGGGGGGRPNLAQAGGKDGSKVPDALALAKQQLEDGLQA